MAEIQLLNRRSTSGVKKSNRLSTRVDLTPMVDLGFLLITFFIFTTNLSEAKALRLVMPDDLSKAPPALASASATLTLLLGNKHTIYFYLGSFDGTMNVTSFNQTLIRTIIQEKMKAVEANLGSKDKTIILIKVTDETSYSDIIDALDEMLINGVKRYMLLDADANEVKTMKLCSGS